MPRSPLNSASPRGRPRASTRGQVLLLVATVLGLTSCVQPPPIARPIGDVVTVMPDGMSRNLLFVAPQTRPLAVVVMFPGGDGVIGIGPDGSIARTGNFLIRTRAQWVAHGFLFVAVDAPATAAGGPGDRVGPANQHAIAAIVQAVRQRSDAPIWLVGTSAGAPAALAGAATLPAGAVHGVVVSSPVSGGGGRDTVFDAALDCVSVPVLIQVHDSDGCRISPPGNAGRLKAALVASPSVDIQHFTGGDFPRSPPCEAFAQHGFLGIEPQVVDAAAAWIRAH
jgi:pimeloyl-ACP methyl ester carboxylesterase